MSESHLSEPVSSQADPSQTTPALAGRQVLLVEDCPDQQRLYLMFLQRAGAEVTLECNGQSAVNTVTKSPAHFDAIVMDFQMPELDGLDATRHLRELGYDGAIIAVTAFGSDELKQSWFQAGCDEYLKKPLNKDELISAVQFHTAAKKAIAVGNARCGVPMWRSGAGPGIGSAQTTPWAVPPIPTQSPNVGNRR